MTSESSGAPTGPIGESILSGIRRNLTVDERQKLEDLRGRIQQMSTPYGSVIEDAAAKIRATDLRGTSTLRAAIKDSTPQLTEKNTARAADAAERQAEAVSELVRLTEANLAVSNAQHETAAQSERFTRQTALWSLFIAAGSLAAAIAALWVSIVK